jgi:hypothetical protein
MFLFCSARESKARAAGIGIDALARGGSSALAADSYTDD